MPYYVGLMSGTSMDGVDAALIEIDESDCKLVETRGHEFPAALKTRLSAALAPDVGAQEVWELDKLLGELFAAATVLLLRQAGVDAASVRAVGSHGQTVFHQPDGTSPHTVQLGDPSTIAYQTGITTVADFRRKDMAAGGQGAPLAPAFHAAIFSAPGVARGVLNLGGIANLSVLPVQRGDAVSGFDTGPANTLLDGWIARHLGRDHDSDGTWASSGEPVAELLDVMLSEPYFGLPPPKSTGRELFNQAWVDRALARTAPAASNLAPQDVQSTLSELTAASVASACRQHAPALEQLLVCGGGAHNADLLARLRRCLPACEVATTADLGWDPDWIEAAAFGWLAHQRLEGRAGNLPAVTGAREPVVLGGVYAPR